MQREGLNNSMIFQQNDAPPHFPKEIRRWLNENFNEKWFGRAGPMSWTARSSELTPLDFVLCEGGDT